MAWRFALLCGSASAAPSLTLSPDFLQWVNEHGKQYATDATWEQAAKAFEDSAKAIKGLNDDEEDMAEYAHTRFSDLTAEEFRKSYLPARMDPREGLRGGQIAVISENDTPTSFDWREKGVVTPIRDQSSCGSCWAESAIGNMESLWFIAKGGSAPVPLSVQQVIECDPHDYSCYGGYPKGAYQYAIESGGLAAESTYPYNVNGHTICLANQTYNQTCGDGMCDDPPLTTYCELTCSDKAHKKVAFFKSWNALPSDESLLASFLYQHGPISVGIDAQGGIFGVLMPWLQSYKKGVANPRGCRSESLSKIDHGVLLVAFGEDDNTKYWTIKNSWGAKWGEQGYFRLIRGTGACAINLMATSVVVNAGSQEEVVV